MPPAPENFADSPPDALSDLLQAVHLRGGEITRSATDRPHRERHPAGRRMLHIVEHGAVRLEFRSSDPVDLGPGDMALLARGDAHVVRATDAGWMTGAQNDASAKPPWTRTTVGVLVVVVMPVVLRRSRHARARGTTEPGGPPMA